MTEFIGIDTKGMRLKATEALGEIVNDPVGAIKSLFHFNPWRMQRAIVRSVFDNPWTSVKACHSSGKTAIAARIALWWATKFEHGIVVTTAPTWTQVEKLMWGEILTAVDVSNIQYPSANNTEIKFAPKNYLMGLSTNDAVRFQGWHGDILIILDEAPGVLPGIYDAIEGIRAGGNVHVLELGNPIVAGGRFFDAFHGNRSRRATFTISALDVPNFDDVYIDNAILGKSPSDDDYYRVDAKSGRNVFNLLDMTPEQLDVNTMPYLTKRSWVREKYDEWGPNHPLWQSKVMGDFPDMNEFALVPLAWAERARALKNVTNASDDEVRAVLSGHH